MCLWQIKITVIICNVYKRGGPIELNQRQEQIIEIVKQHGPITGEHIADRTLF